MHRLFVALRPPPPVRALLLDCMEGLPGARWQDDEQLHVTLRYIGEVERPVAEDVAVALGNVTAPPLKLTIAGVGCFDGKRRERALWAGVAPRDDITALHHKLDRALARIGLAAEGRAYLPHITLARLRRDAAPVDGWLAAHAGLSSAPFEATHFTLFESHLGHEGATYMPIMRWPLHA